MSESTSEFRTVRLQATCLQLRHKMMYCDERQNVPGMVDADSDTRVYFCIKSQESLGPDGKPVHPGECVPGRRCFCSGVASEADRRHPAPLPAV